MGALTVYAISAAICLAFCYLIYKVCLGGATFHRFNRAVLLSVYAISLAAPLLAPALTAMNTPSAPSLPAVTAIEVGQPMAMAVDVGSAFSYLAYVPLVYIAGVAVVMIVTLTGIARIAAIIVSGDKRRIDGATLVIIDGEMSPFSWWRWIVVSRQDTDNYMIMNHERMHIESRHTIDLLLAQLYCAFNWFNPVAWLMRRDLSAQHEYAVDESMLGCGVDARSYQMLIVRKAVGATMGPLANCLHNSQLKNRVKMMLKIKSKSMRRLLAAAIVPGAIAAMAVIETPAVAATLAGMEAAADTVKVQSDAEALVTPDDGSVIKVVGIGSRKKDDNQSTEVHCKQHGERAGVDFKCVVDGTPATEEQLKELKPEDISSISVSKEEDTVYIETKNGNKQTKVKTEAPKAEEMPRYPGGEAEMFHKLAMEIKYPADAVEAKAQGKAVVSFIVNPDGTATDFKIAKSAGHESLDAEAVRACKAIFSRGWIPGKVDGKPATVTFSLPVNFKLK